MADLMQQGKTVMSRLIVGAIALLAAGAAQADIPPVECGEKWISLVVDDSRSGGPQRMAFRKAALIRVAVPLHAADRFTFIWVEQGAAAKRIFAKAPYNDIVRCLD